MCQYIWLDFVLIAEFLIILVTLSFCDVFKNATDMSCMYFV